MEGNLTYSHLISFTERASLLSLHFTNETVTSLANIVKRPKEMAHGNNLDELQSSMMLASTLASTA